MSKLSNKEREELPDSAFAFPKERKEPIENAIHVREATVNSGAAIEIEARDGTTTLLILSRPEEYALPAADAGENPPSL